MIGHEDDGYGSIEIIHQLEDEMMLVSNRLHEELSSIRIELSVSVDNYPGQRPDISHIVDQSRRKLEDIEKSLAANIEDIRRNIESIRSRYLK